MTAVEVRRLVCAALVGAGVALPAGWMLAGRDRPLEGYGRIGPADERRAVPPAMRDFYSPKVVSDPYVLDQQRKVVEALDVQCRHYREHCAEAAQARLLMNRPVARR